MPLQACARGLIARCALARQRAPAQQEPQEPEEAAETVGTFDFAQGTFIFATRGRTLQAIQQSQP